MCSFTAVELLESPFDLVQGSPVVPRVRFRNAVDWSEWSPTTSTVSMQTVPHKPSLTPERIEYLTYGTQLALSYTELTELETGGSPIISYGLEMDSSGGGSGPWTEVQT
jgi:hypothetical protein